MKILRHLSGRRLLSVAWAVGLVPWLAAQGSQIQVGYGVIEAGGGSRLPVASALFSFRNRQDILVAEAGVAAVEPVRAGRIFVDEASTSTGLALVNPSGSAVTLDFTVRDTEGREEDTTSRTLAPRRHTALLVRGAQQLFPDLPSNFAGSLTFRTRSGSQRVAALTIRQSVNAQGEPLLATLPVADLEATATGDDRPAGAEGRVIFPHLGAGGPLSTQIILINPGSSRLTGQVRLTASDGSPLQVRVNNSTVSTIPFTLEPDGTFQALLTNQATVVQGYAVVELESGNQLPVGTAIFQFRDPQGRLMSEAGVGAIQPTTAARIFVDTIDTQTGVAVASPDGAANLTVNLLDRNGLTISTRQMAVPSGGHFSAFADALFPGLPTGFTGLLEIRSSRPFVPITLKLSTNARNALIITTLPIADLTRVSAATSLIFPQLGFGGGFFTRLIFINPDGGTANQFTLSFTRTGDNPVPLTVPLLGQTAASFPLEVNPGGGRQIRPGNTATAAEIVTDPGGEQGVEIAVNRGSSVVVRPLVIDSEGELRDDFPFQLSSLDGSVATVDELGRINGVQTGFSTLTLQAGGRVATAVIAVSSVNQGSPAFQVGGVTGDLAGRLYLSETGRHRLLRSESLDAMPVTYAGVAGSAGLRNGGRGQALFNRPALLALNQADGSLFVADGSNHVVRRVFPGDSGGVETFAGTGQSGSRDGNRSQATFNNPQGLLLDGRGFLWVADTGNHTIRRINLATGMVTTVAGQAGSAGNRDGGGSSARFNSPTGIALLAEPLEVQLQRELRGDPPPPVRVVVADTGNGRVRRVQEDGRVETLTAGGGAAKSRWKRLASPKGAAPEAFTAPASVAVDPIGNIYVSEPDADRVRLILQSGQVVPAGQEGTFAGPRGLYVAGSGRLLVADNRGAGQELTYAAPNITSLAPSQVGAGGGGNLVIRGRNFAPEALVVVAGLVIENVQFAATNRITVPLPRNLPSGRQTVTVQTRGGLTQSSILITPIPLSSLGQGEITTIAGGTTFAGDGNLASQATINLPLTTVLDTGGNLYIADTLNNRIRRVDRVSGIITTVAGTGIRGFSGDDGPAVAAALDLPQAVAVDRRGNIYIADTNNVRIRKVDAVTRRITTIAGNGLFDSPEDGTLATESPLTGPGRIVVSDQGDVYFADSDAIADVSSHQVFRIEAATGRLRLVAGNGNQGYSGDGGPATQASLDFPAALAFDANGNLHIADTNNHVVRRVGADGRITTVAGRGGLPGFTGDGGAATSARLNFPADIAFDGAGNLYIADVDNFVIRRVGTNGRISTVAGNGSMNFSGDGGPATQAGLAGPTSVAVDGSGNIFITEALSSRVRVVNGVSRTISTFAGTGETSSLGDGGAASAAALGFPGAVETDSEGNLYIADQLGNRIRRVDQDTGVISTIAGDGRFAFGGDGGAATNASLFTPADMAVALNGDVYIADTFNNRIRRVAAASGRISTVAGTGAEVADCTVGAFNGDGPALDVQLAEPNNLALDVDGNLLIADTCNHRIRRLDLVQGTVTTIAGNGCDVFRDDCELGDGGPATQASLAQPHDLVVDTAGNIFFADHLFNRVRRVERSTGIITTVAGNGCNLIDVLLAILDGNTGPCALQDGLPATEAALPLPEGLAVDGEGHLFVSDFFSVRRVENSASLTLTNVAGNRCLFNDCALGDGGDATEASLFFPAGLEVTAGGDLLIADSNNLRIRAVRNIATPPLQIETLFFDDVETSGANWTTSSAVGPSLWVRDPRGIAVSGLFSWFDQDVNTFSDQRLTLNGTILLPGNVQVIGLFFQHRYELEEGFDGGVVELSTDGGATWFDAGPYLVGTVYDDTLNTGFRNPLGGRDAFSGSTGGAFVQTAVDLTSFAGRSIRFRFRLGTDESVGAEGWFIDDILLQVAR